LFRKRAATVDGFFFFADINRTFRIYQPLSVRRKISTTGFVLTGPYYTGRASKKRGCAMLHKAPLILRKPLMMLQ